jgi:hypothetical protein
MTPEQAFQLLAKATEALNASRAVHIQIMQALEIIKGLLPKEPGAVDGK